MRTSTGRVSLDGTSTGLTIRQPAASRANAPGATWSTVQRSQGPLVAINTPCAVRSPSLLIMRRSTNSVPARGVGGSSCAEMRSGTGGASVGEGTGVGGTGLGVGSGLTGTGSDSTLVV